MCVPAEPTVNEVIDPIQAIENYKRENKYLKQELALHDKLANRNGISYDILSEQQLYEIEGQCRRFIDGTLQEIDIQNVRQVQGKHISTRTSCISRVRTYVIMFIAVFNALKSICR
jgi:kinesin family member 6/9